MTTMLLSHGDDVEKYGCWANSKEWVKQYFSLPTEHLPRIYLCNLNYYSPTHSNLNNLIVKPTVLAYLYFRQRRRHRPV